MNAGTGLSGGATSGSATLNVSFGSTSTTVAAGNHNHAGVYMPASGSISSTTRYHAIPSCAFMPATPSLAWYHSNGFVRGDTPGQTVTFLAPINIPHGATLTQFIAVIKDSDATENISLRLLRQAATGGGGFISNTLTSSGTPGQVRINSEALSVAIDNLNYAYLVQAWWKTPATDTDVELFHVQIVYKVTTVLP